MFLAQAVLATPASPAPPAPRADFAQLSLVVADTVSETDPQPLCARPDCTSLFLGKYTHAITLAGPPIASDFSARVEMGSPWNRPYRLALIVEQRPGREPLVRAMAGFGVRSHEACFEARDFEPLGWQVSAPRIVQRGKTICVQE